MEQLYTSYHAQQILDSVVTITLDVNDPTAYNLPLVQQFADCTLRVCGCKWCMKAFFTYFMLEEKSPSYRKSCCKPSLKHFLLTATVPGKQFQIEGDDTTVVQASQDLYILKTPNVTVTGVITEEEMKPVTELYHCEASLDPNGELVYEVEILTEHPFELFVQVFLELQIKSPDRLGVSYFPGGIVIFFHGKRQLFKRIKEDVYKVALNGLKGGLKLLKSRTLPPHSWTNKPEGGRDMFYTDIKPPARGLAIVEFISHHRGTEGEFRVYPEGYIQYIGSPLLTQYTPPVLSSTHVLGVNVFN